MPRSRSRSSANRIRQLARALLTALIGAAALLTGSGSPAAAARAGSGVASTQLLAVLLTPHNVRSELGNPTTRVDTIRAYRPITDQATVLPVVGSATTANGVRWLRVMLPGRPNGRRGWIEQRGTKPAETSWHVVVHTASRRVFVYRLGRLVMSFSAVVGKPSTPTPKGSFFVEESVRMPAGSPGAPFALALSARSDVLRQFEGGSGQIAIHGVLNLGGTPGTAVSHGCVRLPTGALRWLVMHVSAGAPVTITS